MAFQSLSFSYKNTPLFIREQIALNEDSCKALLWKAQEVFGLHELLIVSTCNRTEFYYSSDENLSEGLTKLLALEQKMASEVLLPYFVHTATTAESLQYLFEVGTGLQSQVVGDMQIPNQIKQAYQWSADVQMAGPFLHRLMHAIFYTNKRIVQETGFRDGAASTSYASVELIEEFVSRLPNARVLVLGLGEIGTDVCRNLVDKGIKNVYICNRTFEKAEKLSQELGFEAVAFENVLEEIQAADIIISSIQRNEPFITAKSLSNCPILSYKYLIDLSVPRSISSDVEAISGVVLYNIDEIQNKANEALTRRLEAVPQVERIIEESIVQFDDWSKEAMVSPMIQKWKNALEQIRKEELARFMKGLTEQEMALLDKVTSSLMQKFIKTPVVQLKAACKRGDAENLMDTLSDLFDLEQKEELGIRS